VEALGKEGKSPEQIAGTLDVDRATLINWGESNPEFLTALTRAKAFEQQWWEDVGQKALFADKFQSPVWAKSMSARFRDKYTERSDNTTTHNIGDGMAELFALIDGKTRSL
jgi:DNA-binding XRE family transcriptional regulator